MAAMDESCSFEVDVTAKDVETFSQLSGDRNPLHIDAEYARATEYGRPIVHGAFLVGLVSRVLGMHIPGERSLLLSLSVKFPKPLFYPARVQVRGCLKQFSRERRAGVVGVSIVDLAKRWSVLESEASFLLHAVSSTTPPPPVESRVQENRAESVVDRLSSSSSGAVGKPRLLVSGGTGGLGSRLLPDLAPQYAMVCMTRKPVHEAKPSEIQFQQVDLEEDGALEHYLEGLAPGQFYGVLHLSVPPASRAFLSEDIPSVKEHLRHAVEVPLLLARWARQPGSNVKRLVLVGSMAGSGRPRPEMGAYSLGKAAMEHLARLLTADLSAQGATVNVVAPTMVPVGLNEGMSARARAAMVAKMPTGRLVESQDIAAVVTFLLSDGASQINGATIAVDGGAGE